MLNQTYNSAKADIFSAGVTLFLMLNKCPPFRAAHMKDPYFRRLCNQDKKVFWKIYNSFEMSETFKDLFELMTERDPNRRGTIEQIKNHPWLREREREDFRSLLRGDERREVLEDQ